MRKSHYMLVQFGIWVAPPLAAASLLEINPSIDNPWSEFTGYICGISGLLTFGLAAEWLSSWIPETVSSMLFIACYAAGLLSLVHKSYLPTTRRWLGVSAVNLLLSLWSVAFGALWMFGAMHEYRTSAGSPFRVRHEVSW